MTVRYRAALRFCSRQLREQRVIFSPIVYGHQFAQLEGHKVDFRSWQQFNDYMIHVCEELWVLQLLGWQASHGVAHEIGLAETLAKPIKMVQP